MSKPNKNWVPGTLVAIVGLFCAYDTATTGWNLTRLLVLALSAAMTLVLWRGGKEKPRVHK